MKKKILSLALVLAMALTLLPTTAFAAKNEAHKQDDGTTDCSGFTLTWTATGGKHKATCDQTGCSGIAETNCANCITSWTASSDKSQDEGTCPICEQTVTKDHAWNASTGKCSDCDETHSHTWANGTCSGCNYVHPANAHAPAAEANPKYTAKTDGDAGKKHTYTCDTCKKTGVEEACDYTGNVTECTKCGAAKPADQSAPAKIENASFNIETGTLSWTYTPAKNESGVDQTPSEMSVLVVPPTEGGAAGFGVGERVKAADAWTYTCVITVPPDAADGTYTFKISDGSIQDTSCAYVKSSESSHPSTTTPSTTETPKEEEKAPSTDSQGIPVASEVVSASQADEAIQTLVNTNSTTLQERLMSSSAAVSSFVALENAVIQAKGISVAVDVDRNDAPSIVSSGVSVTGAAFNASSSVVRLVVDAPSTTYAYSAGYQISMTLTGVTNPARLAVPVIITLPKPSGIEDDQVVVLHYHDGSAAPSVIAPVVSGGSIRFMVTGFSDFVITDLNTAYGSGYSIGGYGYIGNSNNYIYNNLDALLPTIISMMGDGVFQDVPADYWAAKEIRWARDGGVMGGYADGYFRPGAATTRQQLWMVLARLAGARPADMEAARQWAIANGVSDGTNPSGALSRQQLVTMLYRYAKLRGVDVSASSKLSGYADSAKVASYAKDALSWAVAKGIVTGSNGKLNPEGTATRAHFAVFLNRFAG